MSELLKTFSGKFLACCLLLSILPSTWANTYQNMASQLESANQQFFLKVRQLDLEPESVLSRVQYEVLSESLKTAILKYRPFQAQVPAQKFISKPVKQKDLKRALKAIIYYTNSARLLMLTLSHQALAAILSELADKHPEVQRSFVRGLVNSTQRQFQSAHKENQTGAYGYLYDVTTVFSRWRISYRPQWLLDYMRQVREIIKKSRYLSSRYYTDRADKQFFYELKASLLYLTGKVALPKKYFISIEQVHQVHKNLLPGDLAFIKHHYKLTNLAFQGDWSHSLIYLGTWKQMSAYFDGDAQSIRYFTELCRRESLNCSNFSTYLKKALPEVVSYHQSPSGFRGHQLSRVFLESKGEGVILSNIYDGILKDQLAIIRPKMSRLAKAQAILEALKYVQRSYDYSFSLHTRQEQVCTEIIYNAYSPAPGLAIPDFKWRTSTTLGKPVVYATDLVNTYIKQRNEKNPKLELIYFLKANKKASQATFKDDL